MQVVFDRPLAAGSINELRWNGRGSGVYTWQGASAGASGSQVDIDYEDSGPDVVGPTANYLGGDTALHGLDGSPVAGFSDFPLTPL